MAGWGRRARARAISAKPDHPSGRKTQPRGCSGGFLVKEGGSTAWDDGASGSGPPGSWTKDPSHLASLDLSFLIRHVVPMQRGFLAAGFLSVGVLMASRVTAAQHPTHQSLPDQRCPLLRPGLFLCGQGRALTENDQATLSLERNAVSSPAPAVPCPHPCPPRPPCWQWETTTGTASQPLPPVRARPWLLATSHLPHCFSLSLPLHILKHWPFPGFCPCFLPLFSGPPVLMAQLHLYLYQTPGPVFRAPGLVNPVVGRAGGLFPEPARCLHP